MEKTYVMSSSPHVHSQRDTASIMKDVVIALIPALVIAVYFTGIRALYLSVISVAACLAFEYLITRYLLKKPSSVGDFSAVVTGLLLAFNVPVNLPEWILILGALVSIGIGKMTFGGIGSNPFNPALVGRVFLLISFPTQMTSWVIPAGFSTKFVDAATGATPLALMKSVAKGDLPMNDLLAQIPSYSNLFAGNRAGSLGEVAIIALLVGFVYLLWKKVITWHIPVSIFLTVFVFAGIMNMANPVLYPSPLYHLLTGGLVLGAVFMATDYTTSPMTHKGMIIYGVGIGILTMLIRLFGSYPEGMSFAILIMNALTPLINNYVKPKRFGK